MGMLDKIGGTIVGNVSLDDEKVQSVIDAGLDILKRSSVLQARLCKKTEELIKDAKPENPEQVINWRDKISRADSNVAKALDTVFRLSQLAAGNPDHRTDHTARQMKDLPEDLLRAIMNEFKKAQDEEDRVLQ